jgi:hypothetical protein
MDSESERGRDGDSLEREMETHWRERDTHRDNLDKPEERETASLAGPTTSNLKRQRLL